MGRVATCSFTMTWGGLLSWPAPASFTCHKSGEFWATDYSLFCFWHLYPSKNKSMDLVLFTFFCNIAEMKLHLKPFIINNGFEAEILRFSGAFYISVLLKGQLFCLLVTCNSISTLWWHSCSLNWTSTCRSFRGEPGATPLTEAKGAVGKPCWVLKKITSDTLSRFVIDYILRNSFK